MDLDYPFGYQSDQYYTFMLHWDAYHIFPLSRIHLTSTDRLVHGHGGFDARLHPTCPQVVLVHNTMSTHKCFEVMDNGLLGNVVTFSGSATRPDEIHVLFALSICRQHLAHLGHERT